MGKIFKPALRWDATERAVTRLLGDLAPTGGSLKVAVGAHAAHGSLIEVAVNGAPLAERGALEQRVHERLNPLAVRHEIAWT